MRALLPSILFGVITGSCDTGAYLGLHGIFTAQVTGNLVLIGASWARGGNDLELGRWLAVPFFLGAVFLARLLTEALKTRGLRPVRTLTLLTTALLIGFLVMGLMLAPFANDDSARTVGTAMVGVVAMGVFNVVARTGAGLSTGTTAMTGNSARLVSDLAELALGRRRERNDSLVETVLRLAGTLGFFVAGCAAAAAIYLEAGLWCLALPVAASAWLATLPLDGGGTGR